MRGKVSCIVIVALAATVVLEAGGEYQIHTVTSDALGEERLSLIHI